MRNLSEVSVCMRWPAELKEKAQKAAEKDRRSFADWVRLAVEAQLKKR